MTVNKSLAFLEVLRHNDKRLIDRAVAVRMVFTHCISHDTGTFPVRLVIADTELVHIIEGTPLHWFQPVAHVRQGAGNDHAHGVVNI